MRQAKQKTQHRKQKTMSNTNPIKTWRRTQKLEENPNTGGEPTHWRRTQKLEENPSDSWRVTQNIFCSRCHVNVINIICLWLMTK